jgi:hypothetical protein
VLAPKKEVAGLRGMARVAMDQQRGELGTGQSGEVRGSAPATGGVDGGRWLHERPEVEKKVDLVTRPRQALRKTLNSSFLKPKILAVFFNSVDLLVV